ncbi:hypothetical protein AAVH_26725 [Aphelenchoides avenae]|nr:hypothetical protein AAVH_26725 [Aphelenchus avenae]
MAVAAVTDGITVTTVAIMATMDAIVVIGAIMAVTIMATTTVMIKDITTGTAATGIMAGTKGTVHPY